MKTETLIELQRSEPLNAQLKELENYCAAIGFSETATAITLVPELIAEVIRLREALRACADQLDAETLGGEALDSARAALENDK